MEIALFTHQLPHLTELRFPFTFKISSRDFRHKTLVGHPGQTHHVFSTQKRIPKFAIFAPHEIEIERGDSYVEFALKERVERVCIWAEQCFLSIENLAQNKNQILFCFTDLRDGSPLCISMEDGAIQVHTPHIKSAGEIIQD
eukprot:UN25190